MTDRAAAAEAARRIAAALAVRHDTTLRPAYARAARIAAAGEQLDAAVRAGWRAVTVRPWRGDDVREPAGQYRAAAQEARR